MNFLMKANRLGVALPKRFRLYLCKQMILAVHSLHTLSNMAHCDLKPDNFVITDAFKLALIDFGHSQLLGDTLKFVTGTNDYQPPEIRNH